MDFDDDDEDSLSDASSAFEPIQTPTKFYVTDHCSLGWEELQSRQSLLTDQIASLLGCSESAGATLLRHYQWNKEKLIENYLENPIKVSQAAGVMMDEQQRPKIIQVPGFVCDICCADDQELQTLALACQHRFCRDCFEEYVSRKISEEGESRKIQCPGNCSLIVDECTIEMLVKTPVLAKYEFFTKKNSRA